MIDPHSAPPRPRSLRAVFFGMMVAFLAGLAAMAWAFTHWLPAQKLIAPPDATSSAAPANTASSLPAPTNPQSNIASPATDPNSANTAALPPTANDDRVGALESRLAEIDRHAAASADQATRAEGLLIAFAARRAIDSGTTLGYMEAELTQHYGATQPRAVANIIAASHAPVTLESLRIALDDVSPEADPTQVKGDWWTRFRASFSGLITVRKAGQPSATADERLTRAKLALNTGAVQNALAEIARLPGGTATNAWMTNARRYIEAHSALDILEAAALTRPQVAKPAPPRPEAPTTSAAPSGAI